jgi:diacylglycerol kinase family enzyme
MYTYIYSNSLQEKKYSHFLSEMETDLSVYGISGDIRRLSDFLTLENIIRDVLKKKNQTVIVVGDDKLFFNVFNLLAESKVVLGFIPIEKSYYGEIMGIQKDSLRFIAARRIETLDLGKIGKYYFLASVYGEMKNGLRVKCKDFLFESRNKLSFLVDNLEHPFDGWLEFKIFQDIFFNKKRIASIPIQECLIETPEISEVFLDQSHKVTTPFEIKIAPQALQLIVGRERKF